MLQSSMAKLEIRHYDPTNTKLIIFKPTEEHKKLVEEANKEIIERHRRDLEVLERAKLEIFGQ